MTGNIVFIELGSNQGNRMELLNRAKEHLQNSGCIIIGQSSVYETPPWGFEAKQNFYNQVIKINTNKTAINLLALLQKIEIELGRIRGEQRYMSRTIDLDILFFNEAVIETNELTIPHEHIHLRKFVLEPLCELASNLKHPVLNKTMRQLLNDCPDKSICKKLKSS